MSLGIHTAQGLKSTAGSAVGTNPFSLGKAGLVPAPTAEDASKVLCGDGTWKDPDYLDEILEFANKAAFPATGVTNKLYLALDNSRLYRWSGSQYVEVAPSIALGHTSATAFPGDEGQSHVTDTVKHITAEERAAWNAKITGKMLQQTLSAGSTSVTFTDAAITDTAFCSIFTSKFGVNPTGVTQGTNSVTVTFDAQAEAITVGLKIEN